MRPNYKYDTNYAGGYMLLRYFAKQSAEHYGGVSGDESASVIANDLSESAAMAASLLWTDDTSAMIGDNGDGLTSSMTAVSNAMLMPLDSTGSDCFGTGSLISGLFSNTKNNQSLLG